MSFFNINSVLPPATARYLCAAAEGRVDVALALVPFMATLSTVVQGKFAVMHPAGHPEELCTYWLGIADSSAGKGGIFRNVRQPLDSMIDQRVKRDKQFIAAAKTHNENINAQIKPLRRKLHRLEGINKEEVLKRITVLENEKMPIPDTFLFATQDVTASGLLKLLASQVGNRVGILDADGRVFSSILRDPDLHSVLNQAYSAEPMHNCRANADFCSSVRARLSIGVTTQPSKLKILVKRPELWDEGWLPRVLTLFAESFAGIRPAVGINQDREIQCYYQGRMNYLFNLPWKLDEHGRLNSYVLELESDAESAWHNYAIWLEGCQASGSNLRPIASWLGKAATATLRIAALFHLFERASPVSERINAQHMEFAIELNKSLIPHVQKIYDLVHPNYMFYVLKRIVSWLKSYLGSKEYFTLRDIYRATNIHQEHVIPVICWLRQNGILFDAPAPQITPNYMAQPWGRPRSYGFFVNAVALHNLNLEAINSDFAVQNSLTCGQGVF